MATILVEIDKRALQGGKGCNCKPQQPPQTKQQQPTQQKPQPAQPTKPPAARVMGATAAATPPPQAPATPTAEEKKNEWSLSYVAWLALLSVGVGIVVISQTKK